MPNPPLSVLQPLSPILDCEPSWMNKKLPKKLIIHSLCNRLSPFLKKISRVLSSWPTILRRSFLSPILHESNPHSHKRPLPKNISPSRSPNISKMAWTFSNKWLPEFTFQRYPYACEHFFFNKKINLLTPLRIFNFLIQKWCLKESYLFSNFPTTWTYKKILLYHVNIFCLLFVLSLPCKKIVFQCNHSFHLKATRISYKKEMKT